MQRQLPPEEHSEQNEGKLQKENEEAEKIASEILSHYLPPPSRKYRGHTPLYEAIQTGKYKVVEIILNKRRNEVNTRTELCGSHNTTPLIQAAQNNRLDIVELLIKNGADINDTIDTLQGKKSAFDVTADKAIIRALEGNLDSDVLEKKRVDDMSSKDRQRFLILITAHQYIRSIGEDEKKRKLLLPKDVYLKILGLVLDLGHFDETKSMTATIKIMNSVYSAHKKFDHVQVNPAECMLSGISQTIGWALQQILLQINKHYTVKDCPIPFLKLSIQNGLEIYFKDLSHADNLVSFVNYHHIPVESGNFVLSNQYGCFTGKAAIKHFIDIQSVIENKKICNLSGSVTRGFYSINGLGGYYFAESHLLDQIKKLFWDYAEENRNNPDCLNAAKAAVKLGKAAREQKSTAYSQFLLASGHKLSSLDEEINFKQEDIDLLCVIASDLKLTHQQLGCLEFVLNKGKKPELGPVSIPTSQLTEAVLQPTYKQ